jgi:hypothetical protein
VTFMTVKQSFGLSDARDSLEALKKPLYEAQMCRSRCWGVKIGMEYKNTPEINYTHGGRHVEPFLPRISGSNKSPGTRTPFLEFKVLILWEITCMVTWATSGMSHASVLCIFKKLMTF